MRSTAFLVVSLFSSLAVSAAAAAQDPATGVKADARPTVTVWLMPNEPAFDDGRERSDREIREDIEAYAKRWGDSQPVTLENVTVPWMAAQVTSLNRNYTMPNWKVVHGQSIVLGQLEEYAKEHNLHINLRVLNWNNALQEITRCLESEESTGDFGPMPDVIQIGSSWNGYLNKKRLLLSPDNGAPDAELWRKQSGAMPFFLDIRLLYYWAKLPPAFAVETDDAPLELDATSWNTIVKSFGDHLEEKLKNGRKLPPPMVFPVLPGDPNVIHDYLPLVQAGGAEFLRPGATYVDLTSKRALAVPSLISANMTRTGKGWGEYHLFRVVEESHYRANELMMRGYYTGIIGPVGFLAHFTKSAPDYHGGEFRFEEYVRVAVPPKTFVGGSGLIVSRREGRPDEITDHAFRIARYLGNEYAPRLASQGQIPAQSPEDAVPALLESLPISPEYGAELRKAIDNAIRTGYRYPASPDWPIIESRDVCDRFHRIWRQMGKGADPASLKQAASAAELSINSRTDYWTSVGVWWGENWGWILVSVLCAIIAVAGLVLRYERRKAKDEKELRKAAERRAVAEEKERAAAEKERDALKDLRTIRALSASSMAILDAEHHQFKLHAQTSGNAKLLPGWKKKAAAILALLRDWVHYRDDREWEPRLLSDCIWRSVFIAVDNLCLPGVYEQWKNSGSVTGMAAYEEIVTEFVAMKIREEKKENNDGAEQDEVHSRMINVPQFLIAGTTTRTVAWPSVFEHAFVCLIQNAMLHSDDAGRVSVTIEIDENRVSLSNAGRLHDDLVTLVNDARDIADFSERIREYVSQEKRIGIGLIQAYCIIHHCYGTLEAEVSKKKTPGETDKEERDGSAPHVTRFTIDFDGRKIIDRKHTNAE